MGKGEFDMLDITKISVNDLLNNVIVCNDKGQDPRRVSSHIVKDFFGFDTEESEKTFLRKLERGQHPFQQNQKNR